MQQPQVMTADSLDCVGSARINSLGQVATPGAFLHVFALLVTSNFAYCFLTSSCLASHSFSGKHGKQTGEQVGNVHLRYLPPLYQVSLCEVFRTANIRGTAAAYTMSSTFFLCSFECSRRRNGNNKRQVFNKGVERTAYSRCRCTRLQVRTKRDTVSTEAMCLLRLTATVPLRFPHVISCVEFMYSHSGCLCSLPICNQELFKPILIFLPFIPLVDSLLL